jgi:hypothetical protein
LWAVLAAALAAGPARAQAPAPAGGDAVPAYAQAVLTGTDPAVTPAGCSSCGGGGPVPALMPPGWGGGACACSDGCDSCQCKPGRSRCCPAAVGCADSCLGRFFGGLTECLCCPDPCYEPRWVNAANAAFFQDTVRPRNTTRLRWDAGQNVVLPERAEFFWARPGELGGRGPRRIENRVNYNTLSLYQEIASERFAFFIEVPYTNVQPAINPSDANFGDINLGTKSLLIDCELLQVTFQFKTFIPTGNARNGLGTGHASLEPALLSALKLSPLTYLQGMLAEWIPLGGDGTYAGAIIHYHLSLNHQFFRRGPFELIGTGEFNGWTFQDGANANRALVGPRNAAGDLAAANITQLNNNPASASGVTYVTMGPGLRLVYCENFDIGFGAAFALSQNHWADQLYRTEVRFRY